MVRDCQIRKRASTDDSGCPGGQCGAFTMAALDPVPLDGLNQSEALSCFVMEEAIVNADLNGDGDANDPADRDVRVAVVDRAETLRSRMPAMRRPPTRSTPPN